MPAAPYPQVLQNPTKFLSELNPCFIWIFRILVSDRTEKPAIRQAGKKSETTYNAEVVTLPSCQAFSFPVQE